MCPWRGEFFSTSCSGAGANSGKAGNCVRATLAGQKGGILPIDKVPRRCFIYLFTVYNSSELLSFALGVGVHTVFSRAFPSTISRVGTAFFALARKIFLRSRLA